MKADLTDISFTRQGDTLLTIRTRENVTDLFDRFKDLPVRVEVKQWRERRSLDANGYYWALLSQCADALKISKTRAHNLMLRRYGVVERMDDQLVYLVLPESEDAEETALEADAYHIKPTSQVKKGKDGRMFRTYLLLRGSSSYDSREFSALLNGLVDECKHLGIETRSQEELNSMLEAMK